MKKILNKRKYLNTFNQIISLNGIKVRVFFGKNIEKMHLGHHDKNYYYFYKSNALEIWSKFQKIWVCKKLDKQREWFSPNTDNFLAFFIVSERGRILKRAMDKQELKRNAKLLPNYFFVTVSVLAVVFRRQI